ncbi:hypothetical protein HYU17_04405 [Candidatus Woesearchaeota archaeon]|nr:hypothetical protein [Candidatus Woesearchaeota archaeon]
MAKKEGGLWSSKRALALDIDWIISLGLFLIYLGAFFLAIRQLPTGQRPTEALLDNVADGVQDISTWHVQKLPLLITSNITGNEPVIAKFSYNWQNFSFKDNTSFDNKEGKLMFTRNLREGKNVLELVTSSQSYITSQATFDLTAGSGDASINSKRFMAEFKNSMLARANHMEKERLSDFNISLSEAGLNPEVAVSEANITALSAMYKLSFPQLNHTSFVIAGFSRIFNYINTDAKEPHNLTVSATLRNYSLFYINNAFSGPINYSTQACTTTFGNYIDFYDDISGVTFITPERTNISFCTGNMTARLDLEFSMENETRYDILFHEGSFNTTLKYIAPYKTAFGIAHNITGISEELYRRMNETDYNALKRNWSYPSSREFSMALYNETGTLIFIYQPKIPGITNVFAKEKDVFLLDKYGQKAKHKLRIKGW